MFKLINKAWKTVKDWLVWTFFKIIRVMRNRYHFSINAIASLVLMIMAYFTGTYFYEEQMITRQNALKEAYQSTDVICDILSENPKFAQGQCNTKKQSINRNDYIRSSDSPFDIDVLSYLFLKAKLFDEDDVDDHSLLLNHTEMPGTSYLTELLMGEQPIDSPYLKLGGATTLELIAHLARKLGDEGCVETGDAQSNNVLVEVLARGMSKVKYTDLSPMESVSQKSCIIKEASVSGRVWAAESNAISDNDLLSYVWTLSHANNAEHVFSDDKNINQWANPKTKVNTLKQIVSTEHGLLVFKDIPIDASATATAGETPPLDKEILDKIYNKSRTFSQFLMGKLHSNENVAKKRKELVMFRGYEQHIMLCLLVYVLLILFVRFSYRKRLEFLLANIDSSVTKLTTNDNGTPKIEQHRVAALSEIKTIIESLNKRNLNKNIVYKSCVMIQNKLEDPLVDDVDKMRNALSLDTERLYNSRWVVRWTAITIPAIGFVGTVRGILQSLSQADVIVWASTQSERAAAIGEISGELGLAFATTLIALIIGIGISIFNEHQSKNESNFVFMLEEVASKFLDHRYKGSQ